MPLVAPLPVVRIAGPLACSHGLALARNAGGGAMPMSQKRWIDSQIVTKSRVGEKGSGPLQNPGSRTVMGGGVIDSPTRSDRVVGETGTEKEAETGRRVRTRCSRWQ